MRAGLFSFDKRIFDTLQADREGPIVKLFFTQINANFIEKAKSVIAQAFAPSFASALA